MQPLQSFAAAVAALASVVAAGGGVCTSQYFEPVTSVGSTTGTPFCESKWGTEYLPITTITTWSDSSYVLGLQVTYSDGSVSPIHGSPTDLTEMSIGVSYASDNFTIVDLYQDYGYPYLNSLYVATKSGKIMNAGESVFFLPTAYVQAVGSGVLFGVSGTVEPSTGYLQSLGFQFLDSAIQSIDVTDLLFTNLPVDDEDIKPTTIDTAAFFNNQTSGSVAWTFSSTYTTTTTYTFELQFTEAFNPSESIQVGISGDVPGVTGQSTTDFAWQLQAVESLTATYTTTNDLTWNEAGSNPPGHGVACIATYGRGVANFPFNSTVTVNLQSGHSFSFEESGILSVNDASNVEVECSDDNSP